MLVFRRESSDGGVSSMVYLVDLMLATGHRSLGALSHCLAVVAAVSNCGHRRGGCFGAALGCDHAARPGASRSQARLSKNGWLCRSAFDLDRRALEVNVRGRRNAPFPRTGQADFRTSLCAVAGIGRHSYLLCFHKYRGLSKLTPLFSSTSWVPKIDPLLSTTSWDPPSFPVFLASPLPPVL
jgi:hypothetical protein